jgi:hypothetical protein
MDGTCAVPLSALKHVTSVKKLKVRYHFGDLGIARRIILKWIFIK